MLTAACDISFYYTCPVLKVARSLLGNICSVGIKIINVRCRYNHISNGIIITLQRNLTTKLEELPIDSATGSLFPYYDPDLNLVYRAGNLSNEIQTPPIELICD